MKTRIKKSDMDFLEIVNALLDGKFADRDVLPTACHITHPNDVTERQAFHYKDGGNTGIISDSIDVRNGAKELIWCSSQGGVAWEEKDNHISFYFHEHGVVIDPNAKRIYLHFEGGMDCFETEQHMLRKIKKTLTERAIDFQI